MATDRRGSNWIPAILTVALAACISGCKPDAAVKDPAVLGPGSANPGASQPPVPESASPAGPTGDITGTIIFNGKVPARTIDTSMDPACSLDGSARLPVEQYVVNNGKLANVFLYIKSGPPAAMAPAGPAPHAVVLDQTHCQYVPHVVGVVQGGSVEFRNSDPTMHNVHTQPTDVGNEAIDISMGPRGVPQTKQFRHPELMIPVRCNNHPWMSAFINVSATPFFAVSDNSGRFNLRGLPVGTYTLGAVHEKLGEKTMQVTVAANTASKTEFSFAGQ